MNRRNEVNLNVSTVRRTVVKPAPTRSAQPQEPRRPPHLIGPFGRIGRGGRTPQLLAQAISPSGDRPVVGHFQVGVGGPTAAGRGVASPNRRPPPASRTTPAAASHRTDQSDQSVVGSAEVGRERRHPDRLYSLRLKRPGHSGPRGSCAAGAGAGPAAGIRGSSRPARSDSTWPKAALNRTGQRSVSR